MLNQHGKDFINILEKIKPSKHTHEVFSDWLVMAAASLYIWKGDKATEEEFENVAKQYSEEEIKQLDNLFEITVQALEEREQDFLGEIFTEANLTNDRTGQFFTPYHISLMNAKIIIGEEEPPRNRVCKICDPCCGAGGMLIAGAQVMKERKFNYQQNMLFVGYDIDARCARMAYIQLSLLGVPCEIYCMNTLTDEVYWHRETIGYHMAGMEYRLQIEALLESMKANDQTENKEKSAEIIMPSAREYAQGELFEMEAV